MSSYANPQPPTRSFRDAFNTSSALLRRDFLIHLQIGLTLFLSWVILEVLVVSSQRFGVAGNILLHTLFLLLFSGMVLGYLKISLAIFDGKPAIFSDLFGSIRSGPGFLIAGLAYLAMIGIGFLLLIFPGLNWGAKYGFWGYFMAAEGLGVGTCFRRSAEATHGVKRVMIGYTLRLFLLNILGASLLGLGLVLTIPLTVLILTYLFRAVSPAPAELGTESEV